MATSLAGGCDGSGHGLRMEMLVRISPGPSKHTGLGVDVGGRGAVEEHGCLLFLPPSTFPLTHVTILRGISSPLPPWYIFQVQTHVCSFFLCFMLLGKGRSHLKPSTTLHTGMSVRPPKVLVVLEKEVILLE